MIIIQLEVLLMFDLFGKKNNPFTGTTYTTVPIGGYETQTKEEFEKHRRKEERIAEKISPILGDVVKKKNNVGDTIDNVVDTLIFGLPRTLFSDEVKQIEEGDHLFVQRVGYTHHGIYIGAGRVIHYLLDKVQVDSLEIFADGAKIHKKSNDESPIIYSRDEVVSRAYRRLGEDNYNLIFNNCHSFARWCRCGTKE